MHDFLAQVDNIHTRITSLSEEIASFKASCTASDGATTHDQITTSTNAFSTTFLETSKQISKEIASLSDNTTSITLDYNAADKYKHINLLKSQLRQQIDDFQSTRVKVQSQIREDLARQFRVISPGATPDQIQTAIDSTLNYDDSNNGVFSQATLSRHNNIKALSAARARHQEITRLEQTILELNELFSILATKIEEQQVQVDTVHKESEIIESNMSRANVELDKAVESGRKARYRKWWCLLIFLVIILVSVAVILIALWQAKIIFTGAQKAARV